MSPWFFLTVPVGLLIMTIVVLLLVGIYRVATGKGVEETIERKVQDRIDEEFYMTNINEIWKRHDAGQEMEIYIRINQANITKYTKKKVGKPNDQSSH